ncbi:MAG: gamma-glutamyltransferase family protein [Rhodospirillaceae bacterium]|nr:gamma-glutamyltransferase family protein [Rhodospirillaceae bacterium]MBT6138835.1 gamma-glutamyltransferase family protein [Rhodospirillaceae bacterium]
MRNFHRPGRSPVYAKNAAIATSHPLASEVGLGILRAGGNAVDAAIAACATMCVVEPAMTGIGGDCFALYAPKGASKPIAMNGSGKAPAGATPEALRAKGVSIIPGDSPHSVTIPGAIAAWTKLNADYGSMSMADILAPAIKYAEEGYPVYPKVGTDWIKLTPGLLNDAVSRENMLINGKAPAIGTMHVQPKLGATMRKIAAEGRDGFYTGEVAEDLANRLQGLGGVHTVDDFAAADAEYVEPITTNYLGHDIYECPPNGQGICALILLNILSGFDVASMSEVQRIHIMAEATKLAYRQRDLYVSDPKYTDVHADWLLSAEHADGLRAMIDPQRAGNFHNSDFPTHKDTIYMCCVDEQGNAMSFINSLFAGFGSFIQGEKSGVMLHNRGMSFNLTDGHANVIAPGKRPMHTIIPGMAFKDGKVAAPFGVMGGHYQSTGHATFLANRLALDMDPQEAIDAPRHFAREGMLQVENTIDPETNAALEALGHELEHMPGPIGGGQTVWIDHENGLLIGGSDPRKDGCAMGY